MRKIRIALVGALFIYSPLLVVIIIGFPALLSSFTTVTFLKSVTLIFSCLSLFCLFFGAMLKILPKKFICHFVSVFLFSYVLLVALFIHTVAYQAPDWEGWLLNFYAIKTILLLKYFWGASILIILSLFFMKFEKKFLVWSSICFLTISSLFPVGKELFHRYQLNKFFGDNVEGKIFFVLDHDLFVDGQYAEYLTFDLANRRFSVSSPRKPEPVGCAANDLSPDKKYSVRYDSDNYEFFVVDQNSEKRIFTIKYGVGNIKWSPDSQFFIYDYVYDRDDLSKIFAVDLKTKKTIFLAAGRDPIWRE